MVDEQTQTGTATNSDNGLQPKELSQIERAELAVKRIEEGEKRLDEKIAKLQELESNRLLGGTAGGGIQRMTPEQQQKQNSDAIANDIVKAFR